MPLQTKLPAHILDDLLDSEEEERPVTGLRAATSSDSESEGAATNKDSSDTESEDKEEVTSSEERSPQKSKGAPSIPPEDLEPKQLKKLETMKESPA